MCLRFVLSFHSKCVVISVLQKDGLVVDSLLRRISLFRAVKE